MSTIPISTGDLFQSGRIDSYDPAVGESFLRYSAALTTDTLEFNFPNAQATGNVFGQVRSIYVDNSQNDNDVLVVVTGTRFSFPVYANTTGFYTVDTQLGSTITLTSAGASTGPVEVIFYNSPKIPVVWYEAGPSSSTAVTVADGADVALGNTTDAANVNPATAGTVIAFLKGMLTQLLTLVAGVNIVGNRVTYTDKSGTITVGGTAQTLMAANATRRGYYLQNNSTGVLVINGVGTASATAGIVLQPGQIYEPPITGIPVTAISIWGATAGQRFDAREW